MKLFSPRVAVCLILVLFIGCDSFIPAPPAKTLPLPVEEQALSTLSLPVTVKTHVLKKAILSELPSPLANGTTDRIDAKILATESISTKELVKRLVKPEIPGHFVKDFREVRRTIKVAEKCLIKPWKWGTCWKDVVEIVKEPFDRWVDKIEAVYEYVSEDVTKLLDKVFSVAATIDYKLEAEDIAITFEGQSVNVSTLLTLNFRVNYEQRLVPLGPKVKLKGLLSGRIKAKAAARGDIKLLENAQLQITLPKGGGDLKITEFVKPGAVEIANLEMLFEPLLAKAAALVSDQVDRQFVKQINKALRKKSEELNFSDELRELAVANSDPIGLSENLWLVPNPKELTISQVLGEGAGIDNRVTIRLGLGANPVLVYSETPPKAAPPQTLPIHVGEWKNGVTVHGEIALPFEEGEKLAKQELNKLLEKAFPNRNLDIGKVTIYPSWAKLVVGVDLLERPSRQKRLTVYLWGTPVLMPDKKQVGVDDLAFTVESRKALENVAMWFLNSAVLDHLNLALRFNYEKKRAELFEKIRKFDVETRMGSIAGSTTSLEAQSLYMTDRALIVRAKAEGTATIKIDAYVKRIKALGMESQVPVTVLASKVKEKFFAKSASSNELDLFAKSVDSEEAIAIGGVPASRLRIRVGDTIHFIGVDGKAGTRIAEPKDCTVEGEQILVETEPGKIAPVILDR
jgi:hypothetical protein